MLLCNTTIIVPPIFVSPKSSSTPSSPYSPLICSYNVQRSPFGPCLQHSGFLLSTNEHRVWRATGTVMVNKLLSERNLSWVPPVALSFLPLSSHPSDLCASQISAQTSLLLKYANMFKTLWQILYFLKTWKWKKSEQTCSLRRITY